MLNVNYLTFHFITLIYFCLINILIMKNILLIFVFLTLFVFRLYDDLMQVHYDAVKPNRDYAKVESRKILFKYLIVFIFLLVSLLALYSIWLGLLMLSFIIINHLFYLIFTFYLFCIIF